MLDALIAGAGPAGATTALLLARRRKSVCMYDRSTFPRTKACGEYLSAGTVRLLYELGIGPQLAPQAREVQGVRLHGHGLTARIDFPGAGWSLPRSVLDKALLDAALRAGALYVHGRVEHCQDGEVSATIGVVRLPDGERIEARGETVIGTDGIHSLVARKCGLAAAHVPRARFAVGGHYTGFCKLDNYIDMFVAGSTYVAINPLSDHTANVMIVGGHPDLAESLAHELAGDMLTGTRLDGKRIAIGPLSYRANKLAGSHVLLAGDAAAFLDPFTGQGVYLALQCAQLAADCVAAGDIGRYELLARRAIATRERAARRVARIITSPLLSRAAAALLRVNGGWLNPLVSRVTGAA
jgi:flavin-dependent dehydrogenase